MPSVIFAEGRRRGLLEDAERHAVMREWIIEYEQRLSGWCGWERWELPQSAPAFAGLLFEQDPAAAHRPCAGLGECDLFPARLLAWQRFGGAARKRGAVL
jgi:hypothetical protein